MAEAVIDGTGHRARLRERLLDSAGEALHDHEIVEYLLMLAIPRIDTKPLAKQLLQEFNGLPGLLAADPGSLCAVKGLGPAGAAALRVVQACAARSLERGMARRPVLSSWQALLDYLHLDLAHCATERVRVLHLNGRNMLIRNEIVSEGSIDQAAVHVREVIRRAIELGSAALILVHNHPSGDPSPSKADIALTRSIIDAGRPLDIAVHDHVVVGTKGSASLRAMGLI